MSNHKTESAFALFLFVLVSLTPGMLGSLLSQPGQWYQQAARASFTPPGWVFGPVWTGLYVLMGIAAWRVWRVAGFRRAKLAFSLFALQLALNAAWSPLFFGLNRPGWAFVLLLAIWLAVQLTLLAFWTKSKLAGALLLPYQAWLTFAAVLNGVFIE